MEYGITRLVLGLKAFIETSAEDFVAAKDAKRGLLLALGSEEKFNLLIENYAEYERELLHLTLRHLLFLHMEWSEFIDDLHTLNRRLLNVLAASRLYLDQIRHDISTLFGKDSPEFATLTAAITHEYASALGYRVLDELRNHIQHRALPIHGLSYPRDRDEAEQEPRVRHQIAPWLQLDQLREDPKIKDSVLEELAHVGSKRSRVNVTPLVRQSIQSIGRIHRVLRTALERSVTEWDKRFENILVRARETFGENLASLAAVARESDGRITESTQIFEDLISRRKHLQKKNRNVDQLTHHFISGEATLGDS